METTRRETAWAKTALLVTFCLALLLNLAEALWDPDGQPWLILRIAMSVLFIVTLAGCIALWLRQRRSDTAV